MVFSSYVFLFCLLPAFLAVYYVAGRLGRRAPGFRVWWLIGVSCLFYGWEKYAYVALILFSTLVDYYCVRGMARTSAGQVRRRWVVLSVVTNLGLLGFFKYRNFLIDILNLTGASLEPLLPTWALPVGISFYTFQSMSYTIDSYRGVVAPVRRFSDFMCYVSLFPQLVAGPIVRYRDIESQLVERTHTLEKFARGAFLFMVGFAKKTLIANNVGILAEALFGREAPGFLDAWVGVFSFTFQLYFDFSGYSDMAIGLGLMLGFVFPKNFDAPYKAASITEFWRRWHISLSTWLRDYLYIPLGGNRLGRGRTYINLLITMLLGGLWHGASWTYVLWGAWHGVLLGIERMFGRRPLYQGLPTGLRVMVTFMLVSIGWIMFKAENAQELADVMSGCFGLNGIGEFSLRSPRPAWLPLCALFAATGIVFLGRTTLALSERITWWKAALAWLGFLAGVEQMLQNGFNPFLYFQF